MTRTEKGSRSPLRSGEAGAETLAQEYPRVD